MNFKRLFGHASPRGFFYYIRRLSTEVSKKNGAAQPSAGIIVIGNELLKAQVKDLNGHLACLCLYKRGINVKKISVVSDNVYDIAREIQDFSMKYKYVITSGGIGPTHDDVTFQALAVAFEDKLHYHPVLVDIIKTRFGFTNTKSAALKMAHIPTKAELKFGVNETTGQKLPYPCIVLGNVHVFPGSPMFFKSSFESLYQTLFSQATNFQMTELFINANEESFATTLTAVAKEFPHVSFGSYPEYSRFYKARITVESNSAEETQRAVEKLKAVIPSEAMTQHDRAPHIDSLTKFDHFLHYQKSPARKNLYYSTLQAMLKPLYRSSRTVVFFDGSLESIILIHMARVVLTKIGTQAPIQILCFQSVLYDDERLHNFVQDLIDRYKIELFTLPNESTTYEVIRDFTMEHTEMKFLLVGTRESDLKSTDRHRIANIRNVKSLEIITPLIEWTDQDVKEISERLCLPYYDVSEDPNKTL